jgi:hypothetical protein
MTCLWYGMRTTGILWGVTWWRFCIRPGGNEIQRIRVWWHSRERKLECACMQGNSDQRLVSLDVPAICIAGCAAMNIAGAPLDKVAQRSRNRCIDIAAIQFNQFIPVRTSTGQFASPCRYNFALRHLCLHGSSTRYNAIWQCLSFSHHYS